MGLIHFVQKWNSTYFFEFVKFLNYFDTKYFYFILFPVIWMLFGTYYGRRIFFLFYLCGISNHALKQLFALVRPFHDDPSVGIVKLGGYGFPSGAAQSSILLCALLIYHWKNKWAWLIGIAYTLLISFSRIYLGVHYPLDIYGGWIAGAVLFVIYVYLFPQIERVFNKTSHLGKFITYLAFLGLTFFLHLPIFFYYSSMAIGMVVGVFLIQHLKISFPKTSLLIKILVQVPISILGLFLIILCNHTISFKPAFLHDFLFLAILGFWIGYPVYYSSYIPRLFKRNSKKGF